MSAMNPESESNRYLAFIHDDVSSVIRIINEAGGKVLIIRKHTDCTEVDFRLKENSHFQKIQNFIKVQDEIIPVREDFSDLTTGKMLLFADQLIDQERYWEAHNIIEELWKHLTGYQKQVLHDTFGIIVSQIKVQMNQAETGQGVFQRNIEKLRKNQISVILDQMPEKFTYPIKFRFSPLLKILSGETKQN